MNMIEEIGKKRPKVTVFKEVKGLKFERLKVRRAEEEEIRDRDTTADQRQAR